MSAHHHAKMERSQVGVGPVFHASLLRHQRDGQCAHIYYKANKLLHTLDINAKSGRLLCNKSFEVSVNDVFVLVLMGWRGL